MVMHRDAMQSTPVPRAATSMGDPIACTSGVWGYNGRGRNCMAFNPSSFHSRANQDRVAQDLPRRPVRMMALRLVPVVLCLPRAQTRPMFSQKNLPPRILMCWMDLNLLSLRKDRIRECNLCLSEGNILCPISLPRYPPSPSSHHFGSPPSLARFIHSCRC